MEEIWPLYEPRKGREVSKQVVRARWVLTPEMADGHKSVEAGLAAKGFQDPGPQAVTADASGRVSPRLSPLQASSLCAIKKWMLWSLDVKNAFLRADGFTRDALLQAPIECEPLRCALIWKLKTPAFRLDDAPLACHRDLEKHLLNSDESVKQVRLPCHVLAFDTCLLFIFGTLAVRLACPPPIFVIFLDAGNRMLFSRFGNFRNGDLGN